jgi:2-succinyl-5-enolpyruvyl-6-hydroxy-3-cyclohexene-1-carboxylate synthase
MTNTIDTYRLLRALCDEFARCGMRHACTSPGSRNTPIVLSLVGEPRIRCWSHIDERSAGFFAVGAAKTSGTPVAMTCTSGTAAANLAPAVIEAWWARLPLIVLTADRPAELRDVGAGQAIDQLKLYGDAVRWFCEVELPPADPRGMRWIRQLACRAYWTAAGMGGAPGPVHLNLPLREPLVLDGPLEPEAAGGRADGRPWVSRGAAPRVSVGERRLPARGVIVAGRDERGGGASVASAAARLGYPLLADPLSGARHGDTAIATYDLLLRDPGFAERVAPGVVVRVGDLPTSKPLRAWLASLSPDVEQIAISAEGAWQDPDAVASEIIDGGGLEGMRAEAPDRPWLEHWLAADDAAVAALGAGLGEELSEPLVARRLGEWLPAQATLFVASSMPIRDVELYLPARRPLPRVLSNRGANGIDGTVSAAFGAAAATGAGGGSPVVLLIGDVALAHDIGGLLAARRLGLELTIVLLNNDGGGIFHFLAVSGEGGAFEEHVATPHGLDFALVAELYGLRHHCPRTPGELRAAVEHGLSGGGVRLIEVRTDRVENLALHRRAAEAALAAIRG